MISTTNALILGITAVYLLLVVAVGAAASRITGDSREDFLMASRSFGTVVLLFALFATNMTSVVMIGAPSLAYSTGISAYGFFVALFAFLFPVFLMTFGYRIWIVGKEFGHITPGQIFNHRWEADNLGFLVMGIFTVWTIPYILIGVQGGGIVFESLTEGLIPYWLGALITIIVVGMYVYPGGMRGTGWTNTFQGIVFVIVLFAFFLYVPFRIGGFGAATDAVAQLDDGVFLNREGFPQYETRMYFSQGIIVALGSFMFPHLILRYMTARSFTTLKQTSVIYPVAILLAWVPTVMLGFWGIAQLPNLENPDFILPELAFEFFPTWAVGLALAGILAAMMSSIDGQVLTLSTFFGEDVLRKFWDDVTDAKVVWYTRVFLVVIFVLAYIGALLTSDTIVDTATFAFAGYGLLFVPMAAAFYWRNSTKASIYAGVIYGFVGIWSFEYGPLPPEVAGFHPFVLILITQILLMAVVALVTQPPSEDRIDEYEECFEDIW